VDGADVIGDPDWQAFLDIEAETQLVTIGRQPLRVVSVGEGEPVLLVHGIADSAYTWHNNLRPLAAAGFRAIAFDYPGSGGSQLCNGFRFGVDDLTELALGLLDALGIERSHYIGHSMGGGIGLQLAVHHAERLQRAVLVAPTCYHALFRPFVYLFRWAPFGALARNVIVGPWMVFQILASEYVDTALLTRHMRAQYELDCRRPECVRATVGLLRDYWNDAFKETARLYREIEVPLYLVWGRRDRTISPRYGRRLAADTGAPLTVVEGTGHLVHQARPDVFNDTAIRFLRGDT
jgi:pimeloyl-ACP methyl ester carboxylesterase